MVRFPQASKLAEGYDVAQVDAFISRLDTTLRGNAGSDAVSLAEVWGVRFSTHRVGARYDEDAVDAELDALASRLQQALLAGGFASAATGGANTRMGTLLDKLAGDPGTRFPRKRLTHGYLITAVDALTDQIVATLHGAATAPCTSGEIERIELRTTIGGYDTFCVDAVLAEAVEVLATLPDRHRSDEHVSDEHVSDEHVSDEPDES